MMLLILMLLGAFTQMCWLIYLNHISVKEHKLLMEKDIELINLRATSYLVVNAVRELLEASHDSNGIKFIERDRLADLIYNLRTRTKDLRNEIDSSRKSGDNRQETGLVSSR